jgi:hypothetical protein
MEKNPDPGSGTYILDLIFENLVQDMYQFFLFGLKILKFFDADPDLGSCQPYPG